MASRVGVAAGRRPAIALSAVASRAISPAHIGGPSLMTAVGLTKTTLRPSAARPGAALKLVLAHNPVKRGLPV